MTDLRSKANALRGALGADRKPPEDTGERLATIPRDDGSEVRISWASYEGKPYLAIQRWRPGVGGFWPDREQRMTVRLRELSTFAEGLALALDKAEAHAKGRR